MKLFLLLISLCLTNISLGGGKRDELRISFHVETNAESGKKLTFQQNVAGKPRIFDSMAVLSLKDFVAFGVAPAKANDGTFAVAFQIKPVIARRFHNMMLNERGHYLIAQINGRFPDVMFIDQPKPTDRIIIHQGITQAEIDLIDQELPRFRELKKD